MGAGITFPPVSGSKQVNSPSWAKSRHAEHAQASKCQKRGITHHNPTHAIKFAQRGGRKGKAPRGGGRLPQLLHTNSTGVLTSYRSDVSTIIFINIVSCLTYACLFSSVRAQNRGQPLAMFISLRGLWKDELLGSGLKASITCSTLS